MDNMQLTAKEAATLETCLNTLYNGAPVLPRLEELTPTMNVYHLPEFTVHVRRCVEAGWTWVEAFRNPQGNTVYSFKVVE